MVKMVEMIEKVILVIMVEIIETGEIVQMVLNFSMVEWSNTSSEDLNVLNDSKRIYYTRWNVYMVLLVQMV